MTKIEWCDYRKGHSRIHSHNGYMLVYCPGHPCAKSKGHVYEHRYMVEKHLKRFLQSHEVVHHINRDPGDNRTENLVLTLNSAHVSKHYADRPQETIKRQIKALRDYAKSRKLPRITVLCACGCGESLTNRDKKGRPREYIHGHQAKGRTWKWQTTQK